MTFSWIRKIGTFMMLQKGKEGRECGDGGGGGNEDYGG